MNQTEAYSALLDYVFKPPSESHDLSGFRAVALLGMLPDYETSQFSKIVGTEIKV